MAKEIKIEKNVPVPTHAGYGDISNTLRKMKVGDSFFYCDSSSVRSVAHRIKKETGFTFITRKETGGVRVWRVG